MLMVKKWLTVIPCQGPELIGTKPENFRTNKKAPDRPGPFAKEGQATQYLATSGVPQLK
jgi:hypothetical protein